MSRGTSSIDRALAVYRDHYLVAVFRDRPGNIVSALRGSGPALEDAVVSGEIKSLEEEETLAGLVRNAASVDVLIDALEDAGYSVKPTPSI